MIIDCISDLHGFVPPMNKGDILIVAGDLTARDRIDEHLAMWDYLSKLNYKKVIVIAGNHDSVLQTKEGDDLIRRISPNLQYLCDSGTEFEGLNIWGSPWTKRFEGMNPKCMAFTVDTDEELDIKFSLIPNNVDILVTHSPPYGILDKTASGERVGSKALQWKLFTQLRPKLFVCGHIHEAYGIEPKGGFIENAVNASFVNEFYQPVNKPVRIEL